MTTAFFIIDVQNDFCEGGSLACAGGAQAAANITAYLSSDEAKAKYDFVIASRDWHDAHNDNGGHFAHDGVAPDFVNSWPVHCVADSEGGNYHANLDDNLIDFHIQKGQGKPAYSIFEGNTPDGETLPDLLGRLGVTEIDVAGIATDYCVLASALDANTAGFKVSVLPELCAGVAAESSGAAIAKLEAVGVTIR